MFSTCMCECVCVQVSPAMYVCAFTRALVAFVLVRILAYHFVLLVFSLCESGERERRGKGERDAHNRLFICVMWIIKKKKQCCCCCLDACAGYAFYLLLCFFFLFFYFNFFFSTSKCHWKWILARYVRQFDYNRWQQQQQQSVVYLHVC